MIAVRPIISNIHPTDLYGMCTYGRTLAVDERSEVIFFDPSRDVAMATNFRYRAMLCIRGTSHGPVSVRPPVCLSVRPSVTSRCSTKTAKRRITQTSHDSPGALVFLSQRSPRNSTGVTPTGAPNAGGVGQNRQLSTNNRLYLENGKRETHSFY